MNKIIYGINFIIGAPLTIMASLTAIDMTRIMSTTPELSHKNLPINNIVATNEIIALIFGGLILMACWIGSLYAFKNNQRRKCYILLWMPLLLCFFTAAILSLEASLG